jgi:hypothetical protein
MAAAGDNHHETDPLIPTHTRGPQIKWKSLLSIFIALTLAVFVASLDETIVSCYYEFIIEKNTSSNTRINHIQVATAALNIVAQFQAFNLYSWVSVSYLICLNASQPLYGMCQTV